jgi:hypothetical protein
LPEVEEEISSACQGSIILALAVIWLLFTTCHVCQAEAKNAAVANQEPAMNGLPTRLKGVPFVLEVDT